MNSVGPLLADLLKKSWIDSKSHTKAQVKLKNLSMLVHKYELFKIEPNKIITSMYTRFNDIINNLKILKNSYTDSELCRKVLRSLPHSWKAKVTTIHEANDLTSLRLEELEGS